jgi:hypothetical protein
VRTTILPHSAVRDPSPRTSLDGKHQSAAEVGQKARDELVGSKGGTEG